MISAAVEGIIDEVIARKMITHVGGEPGVVYGMNGKPALREKIGGYNNAARFAPWLVLIDLDNDSDCAPPIRQQWLAAPAQFLCFRIAVRQVEAWLMGDAETLATYLRVSPARISGNPEELVNSKMAMVNLARRSRRRAIREDMVPRESSGRTVGPAYTSRMMEYAEQHWRPAAAAGQCDSLRRALDCLAQLVVPGTPAH